MYVYLSEIEAEKRQVMNFASQYTHACKCSNNA